MKYLKLFPIIILVMFLSCKKDSTSESHLPKESNNLISRVSNTADFETLAQMLNLMDSCERYTLWKNHLDSAIAQFQKTDSAKAAFLSQLLPYLNCSVFADSSSSADILFNYVLPAWIDTAETIFTDMELWDILYDPTEDSIGSRTAPPEIGEGPGGGEGTPGCFCNVGTRGFVCSKLTISIPPSLVIGVCEKSNAECNERRWGCGWFLAFRCNGNHCSY